MTLIFLDEVSWHKLLEYTVEILIDSLFFKWDRLPLRSILYFHSWLLYDSSAPLALDVKSSNSNVTS